MELPFPYSYLASREEGKGGDPIPDGGGWSCHFPFLTSPLGRRERVAIPSKMAEVELPFPALTSPLGRRERVAIPSKMAEVELP